MPFFDWKGIKLGVRAAVNLTREALVKKLTAAVGGPVSFFERVRTLVAALGDGRVWALFL